MKKKIALLFIFILLTLCSCTWPASTTTKYTIENVPIKMWNLTVNGQVIFDKEWTFDYSNVNGYVYNINDLSTDSIQVTAKTNRSNTTVTLSKSNGFAVGENPVTITVSAPDKTPLTAKLMVCKYDKQGLAAFKIYEKAKRMSWYDEKDFFEYIDSDVISPPNFNPLTRVSNYNQIMAQNYTKSGIKQFEVAHKESLYKTGGKVYATEIARGSDISYIGTLLVRKSLTDDTDAYIAKSYYYKDDTFNVNGLYEENFTLKKEQGKWLIDEFTNPD